MRMVHRPSRYWRNKKKLEKNRKSIERFKMRQGQILDLPKFDIKKAVAKVIGNK